MTIQHPTQPCETVTNKHAFLKGLLHYFIQFLSEKPSRPIKENHRRHDLASAKAILFIFATTLLLAGIFLPTPVSAQGTTTRVSVDSTGLEADDQSGMGSITPDGRYVAFVSSATNLILGDTNGQSDIFVHDRQTGLTTRVSVSSAGSQGDDWSASPNISDDARYVTFSSVDRPMGESSPIPVSFLGRVSDHENIRSNSKFHAIILYPSTN